MSEYLNIGLDITGLLDNSPTHGKGPALIMCRGVEYMPVRHGRWIECVSLVGKSICSNCRLYWIDTDSQYDFNYCPRCGAKMDGEEQEHAFIDDSETIDETAGY